MPVKPSASLVAWDIDDVLNDLTLQWASWVGLEVWELVPPTGDSATWVSSLGMKPSEYLESLDAYRNDSYKALEPNPFILQLLSDWPSQDDTHIALTATPLFAQSIVAEWTMRHFGDWFRGVWFCPSQRPADPPGMPATTKGGVLSKFRVRALLIDDSVSNLATIETPNVGLLYPRPWNSTQTQETLKVFLANLHQTWISESEGVRLADGC